MLRFRRKMTTQHTPRRRPAPKVLITESVRTTLRVARQNAGLTQKQAAYHIGIKPIAPSHIERGIGNYRYLSRENYEALMTLYLARKLTLS